MEKIVRFEDLAGELLNKGNPLYMHINKQDDDIFFSILGSFYERASINDYWYCNLLGHLDNIAVYEGIHSRRCAKVFWN